MENIKDILHQQIRFIIKSLEKGESDSLGNDTRTLFNNLSFGVYKDYMIIGWIFKSLYFDINLIKKFRGDTNFQMLFKEINFCLKEIDDYIDEEPIIISHYWDTYFNIKSIIRKSLYKEDDYKFLEIRPEFSKDYSMDLVDSLDKNRALLLKKGNDMINTIVNENYRVSHMFGGKDAYILHLVLIGLSQYYDYFKYEMELDEDNNKKKSISETSLNKYINLLSELRGKFLSNKFEDIYIDANLILINLGIDCRIQYLFYGENPYKEKVQMDSKKIDLPESVKNKLSEAIAKSLDKEFK